MVFAGVVQSFVPGHVPTYLRFARATQGAGGLTAVVVLVAAMLVKVGARRSVLDLPAMIFGVIAALCATAAGVYETVEAFGTQPIVTTLLTSSDVPHELKVSAAVTGVATALLGLEALIASVSAMHS